MSEVKPCVVALRSATGRLSSQRAGGKSGGGQRQPGAAWMGPAREEPQGMAVSEAPPRGAADR